MGDTDLKKLVGKIKGGDSRSWNELVSMHQRRVFATALAVMCNLEEADEVAQEVFMKLFSNIEKIKNPDAIPAWLIKTSANLSKDRLRFRKVRQWLGRQNYDADRLESNNLSPEKSAAIKEMSEVVERWSRTKLTGRERIVCQFKLGEEMTFDEIAKSLGISVSTAKTHYSRAIAKLEKKAKAFDGEVASE